MADASDEQIAAFYEAVKAKAMEEVEIEGKQAEVLEAAGQATQDQLEAEASGLAQVLATFYAGLYSRGVDVDTTAGLCRDHADYLRDYGDFA